MFLNLEKNKLHAINFLHLRVRVIVMGEIVTIKGIVIGQTNLLSYDSPRLTILTDKGKFLENIKLHQVHFERSALSDRIQKAYKEANDLQGLQRFLNKTTL